jgi:hypothetical protein
VERRSWPKFRPQSARSEAGMASFSELIQGLSDLFERQQDTLDSLSTENNLLRGLQEQTVGGRADVPKQEIFALGEVQDEVVGMNLQEPRSQESGQEQDEPKDGPFGMWSDPKGSFFQGSIISITAEGLQPVNVAEDIHKNARYTRTVLSQHRWDLVEALIAIST